MQPGRGDWKSAWQCTGEGGEGNRDWEGENKQGLDRTVVRERGEVSWSQVLVWLYRT